MALEEKGFWSNAAALTPYGVSRGPRRPRKRGKLAAAARQALRGSTKQQMRDDGWTKRKGAWHR